MVNLFFCPEGKGSMVSSVGCCGSPVKNRMPGLFWTGAHLAFFWIRNGTRASGCTISPTLVISISLGLAAEIPAQSGEFQPPGQRLTMILTGLVPESQPGIQEKALQDFKIQPPSPFRWFSRSRDCWFWYKTNTN